MSPLLQVRHSPPRRSTPAVGSRAFLAIFVVALLPAAGCVERIMKIQTDPPGATVIVNDEEVGISPVRFSFLWYGDYDLIFRKPGYQTLHTHYRVDAPWYQCPPIDLFAETLVPATITDERVLPVYALHPAEPPAIADLVERASAMRERALFESSGVQLPPVEPPAVKPPPGPDSSAAEKAAAAPPGE